MQQGGCWVLHTGANIGEPPVLSVTAGSDHKIR
eukprot:SAG11_NODE_22948_length_397_cov_1.597315_1_plen_32_part_01